MQIVDYKYLTGTAQKEGYLAIPELNRLKPSVPQFIKLACLDIKLTVPAAFLYIEGFSVAQSDSGLHSPAIKNYVPALKGGSSYICHEWIHTFEGVENLVKVDIVSGTCAAGIQAIHEADRLFNEGGIEEVIVIGGERITADTVRLFKELGVKINCGDGFVYMRLKNSNDGKHTIVNPQWKFAFNKNPFNFTRSTIDSLVPDWDFDYVKLHGTGTPANNEAESGLEEKYKCIKYKNTIGHTQGISSLVETCMLLDDDSVGESIYVTANGVGGFYGGFELYKND